MFGKTSARNCSVLGLFLVILAGQPGFADSLYGNNVSASSTSLGGAVVASPNQPLDIMTSNPAGLGKVTSRDLSIGFAGMFTQGNFRNASNPNASIDVFAGAVPYAAFVTPIRSSRVKLGFAVTPESSLAAHWHYFDSPGGLGGTSYGIQENRSAILAMRFAGGVGVAINKKLSLGLTVGAVYNSNSLKTPYVFQSNPLLKGFKTLIDLHTQGWAPNASAGLLYAPTSKLQFGVSYKARTSIHTHGDLDGNAAAQLATLGAPLRPDFHYDAQVDNVLPQMVSGGFSWQMAPRVRLAMQTDWINWNKAFTTLPITLTNGNNSDINGFLGTSTLKDGIPLNWSNQTVFRVGVESSLTERTAWRIGYSYGNNPVPASTVMPLTAAIMQSALASGIGYHRSRYGLDVTYQYQLPNTEHVGVSALQAGEYSNSRIRIGIQSVAATTSIHF